MIRYKKSELARLPVILKDTAGAAMAGVAAAALNIDIVKSDGTVFSPSPSATLWTELTSTAYASQGYYNYLFSGTIMNTTGVFQYCFIVTGSAPYFGVIEIVENTEKDVMDRLGVPTYGTIKDDIANVGISAASGGFTAQDRTWLSATYVTASLLPADPASNSHIDSQLSQSFWTNDRLNLNAIKSKTDNLPVVPASQGDVTSSRDNINTNTNNQATSINNNTNSNFTTIKGAGWGGSIDTLRQIGVYTNYIYNSGALSATVIAARDYLAGTGFVTGTDDLHGLAVAIQGITPGSGGGGFSNTDRAMLEAAYSHSILLPDDPASASGTSGTIALARGQIMGSGTFTGSAAWGRTVKEVYDYQVAYLPSIYTTTGRIPSDPATNTVVNAARDYLAGAGYVQVSDSLHAIMADLDTIAFSSSFTAQDRAYLTQTLSGVNKVDNTTTIIKQKTDLLPNDVVSSATLFPLLYEISSSAATSGGFSNTDRTNIEGIKAKTDNLPAQPADATVTFGAGDRSNLNIIYSKTNNLPIDPASITYTTQVSQSLANLIIASTNALSSSISGTNSGVLGRLGTPAGASVSADIAAVYTQASQANTNAASANSNATAAATNANNANNSATAAGVAAQASYNEALATHVLLGTPMSGSVSADISSSYNAILNISASVSASTVDLTPVLKVLGSPISTVSRDIYEVARLVKTKK
jgi:hypothetical protein